MTDALLPWLLPSAMLLALALDRLLGEPPAWAHPVVAMGRYLGACSPRLLSLPPLAGFLSGAALWILGTLGCVALALLVEAAVWQGLEPWRSGGRWLLAAAGLALLLKPLLAWRMLAEEVLAVEQALQHSPDEGRARLSRLVSRDTSALSPGEVREAAIETLAENLNDSVIAPLFWFAVAGLPGAAMYRFANTADAMWGYRGRWEWAGKWAARADDMLSWLPARLSGLLMLSPAQWFRLSRQAALTPSPNGGWPMGAMALRLGCRLGKPGVYSLNAASRAPGPDDLPAALRVARHTLALAAALLMLAAAGLRGGLA